MEMHQCEIGAKCEPDETFVRENLLRVNLLIRYPLTAEGKTVGSQKSSRVVLVCAVCMVWLDSKFNGYN